MKIEDVIKKLGFCYKTLNEFGKPFTVANDNGYYGCDICYNWETLDKLKVTAPMNKGAHDICFNCMENKPDNDYVISAKLSLKDNKKRLEELVRKIEENTITDGEFEEYGWRILGK